MELNVVKFLYCKIRFFFHRFDNHNSKGFQSEHCTSRLHLMREVSSMLRKLGPSSLLPSVTRFACLDRCPDISLHPSDATVATSRYVKTARFVVAALLVVEIIAVKYIGLPAV